MSVFNPNPTEFPSLWACAWGQDKYGYWQAFKLNDVQQVMRWIPPGVFQMGSPDNEAERLDNENLHSVTLTQGYWLAETACSQSLWLAVMEDNPSDFSDNLENPVNRVSWLDCQRFFTAANTLLPEGLILRFPTEAEWEYACRANTQTAFSWGNGLSIKQANYDGNFSYHNSEKGEYRQRVVEVLKFSANPWGLYQMHGNVWEWCEDLYVENLEEDQVYPLGGTGRWSRVLRGGGWNDFGLDLRSAIRDAGVPGYRS
ncbi:MAG: formylglycine-generating enzyme family protein, partial [Methylococcaceae bacterium]